MLQNYEIIFKVMLRRRFIYETLSVFIISYYIGDECYHLRNSASKKIYGTN